MPDIGDFSVSSHALDSAREEQSERSSRSKGVDAEQRAPVTTSYPLWESNPQRYDFPGIDTPSENPRVREEDLKQQNKPTLTRKARGETPVDPQDKDKRELDLFQAQAAKRDVSLSPEEGIKGTNSGGFGFGGPTYNAQAGRPVETDRVEEEQKPPESALREQGQSNKRQSFNLPDQTLSTLRTGLNERTDDYFDSYEPEKEDRLESIRQRISVGEPLELSKDEYREAERIVREEKEDATERAGRMDRNIFGSTEEQAQRAKEAHQGFINNPPW